jgi:hypothetical protein
VPVDVPVNFQHARGSRLVDNQPWWGEALMVKKRCCGHHCPVCGNPARPLEGWSRFRVEATCRDAGDVPWRWELGRIAHKCYGAQHRFDVDINTDRALPEYLYKIEKGGPIKSALAGAPREKPLN